AAQHDRVCYRPGVACPCGTVTSGGIANCRTVWERLSLAAAPARRRTLMLELYHNNISVCAQKVRIVLAEKNLPWTNHHLSLAKGDQLTSEFKKMNPRGVVPVLLHDGSIIIESSVICTYLDEVFPTPPLMPTNPVERATMRLWCKLPDDILHMA